MTLSAFGFNIDYIVDQLFGIPGFVLFLSFRGFCQAWTAHKLGDNTAYINGYMTMDPRKHINPIGFILLILLGFGFNNPVPVNTRNFKNIKRDNAIQILSSPVGGIILTIAMSFLLYLLFFIGSIADMYVADPHLYFIISPKYILSLISSNPVAGSGSLVLNTFMCMIARAAVISVQLSIFFLIPLPNFDGYRLIANFLPYKYYRMLYNIEKYSLYIFIGFIILLDFVPAFSNIITVPASAILNGICYIFSKIVYALI